MAEAQKGLLKRSVTLHQEAVEIHVTQVVRSDGVDGVVSTESVNTTRTALNALAAARGAKQFGDEDIDETLRTATKQVSHFTKAKKTVTTVVEVEGEKPQTTTETKDGEQQIVGEAPRFTDITFIEWV